VGLEKAVISKKGKSSKETVMKVQFNPETYSLSRNVEYQETIPIGRSAQEGKLQFKKNNFYEFSVTLIFDTYETKADVRAQIKKLNVFIEKDKSTKLPNTLIFAWGTFTFSGVLQSMSETYTMFHEDGNPIRAKVELKMKGLIEDGKNSSARAKEETSNKKVRHLIGIEGLWALAQKEYNDANKWRHIAKENKILNPRKAKKAGKLRLP